MWDAAFVCLGTELSIAFNKKIGAGLFGGEGLFLTTLQGTSRVWLQSLPFSRLADRILKFAPSQGGKNMGEGSVIDGAVKLLQR